MNQLEVFTVCLTECKLVQLSIQDPSILSGSTKKHSGCILQVLGANLQI
jgi:hypothetical protein